MHLRCLPPPSPDQSKDRRPDLVPRGWTHDAGASSRRVIGFTSPNRRATLTIRDVDTSATAALIQPDADERVTCQKRGRGWRVLSGYRGDTISYRRGNFAYGR